VSGALRGLLLGAALLLAAGAASAKNTGVGDDPVLQSGPCYEALIDKNAATPTTAPNRELGAACEAEHGEVDKAWARVVRLWGSDTADVPDYDSYRRADAPVEGAAPKWLAALGVLLTYAVLGAPMRSAARWFGAYPGRPGVGGVVAALILRGLICAVFTTLLGVPYLAALGAVALIVWTILRPRASASVADAGAAGLAETINDTLGVWPALAALALFAQLSWLMLAFALALGLIASLGPVIAARRLLRATPLVAAIASATLAAALGEALVYAPPVSGWLGGAWLFVPLGAAALALAAGLTLARPARLARGDAGV
jgi:hypothetical protein